MQKLKIHIDALATHSNEPENLYSSEHVDCYPNIIEAPIHHENKGIFSSWMPLNPTNSL